MLSIYRELFSVLNKTDIKYCLYKSLIDLEYDLSGNRGDLDILIDESDSLKLANLLKRIGFIEIYSKSYPKYFLGTDKSSKKTVLIDVDTSIRCGHKPTRPFKLKPKWDEINVIKLNYKSTEIKVLSNIDYFFINFIIRCTSRKPKYKDLVEIKGVLDSYSLKNKVGINYYDNLLMTNSDISPINSVESKGNWKSIKKYWNIKILKIIEPNIFKRFIKHLQNIFGPLINRVLRIIYKRIFMYPSYKTNCGLIVAFVGVDGSGKSSTIDTLMQDKKFILTGIKRLYFGNNEYWIPGLISLTNERKPKFIQVIGGIMKRIDRQLRIIPALFCKWRKNIVLCDRYYYDDLVSKYIQSKSGKNTGLMSILKSLFRVKFVYKPDITFYLKVDPDVAYKRKKDYPYAKMVEVNDIYNKVMSNRSEVYTINANEKKEKVLKKINDIIVDYKNKR